MQVMTFWMRVGAVAAVCAGVSPAAADVYKIDKDHTEVRFTWDHVGMSRQGGRFRDVTGTLNFDPINPGASTVDVRIKVGSLSTGVSKLDEQLVRSGEFFDTQAYPEITFKSTAVAPSANRTAQVTGTLSVNGVAKPVVLNVRWNFTGEHPLAPINPVYKETFASGFSAKTQILRSDFGISRTIPFVSDEIQITIETEFHRTQVTSPQPEAGLPAPGQPSSGLPAPGLAAPRVSPAPGLSAPGQDGAAALPVPQTGALPSASPEPGAVQPNAPLPPVDGGAPHAGAPDAALPPVQPYDPLDDELSPNASEANEPPPLEPLDPSQRLDN